MRERHFPRRILLPLKQGSDDAFIRVKPGRWMWVDVGGGHHAPALHTRVFAVRAGREALSQPPLPGWVEPWQPPVTTNLRAICM